MKIIASIMLTLVAFCHVSAQNAFACTYSIDISSEKGTDNYYGVLCFNDANALFTDISDFMLDSVRNVSHDVEVLERYKQQQERSKNYFDQTVWKDALRNVMEVYSVIVPNYYKYQEPFVLGEWNFTDTTATVCGYVCNMATIEYGGRSWKAYYTNDIPVSFGPWKFGGLPGLILQVEDTSGAFSFKAIQIRKYNLPFSSPQLPNVVVTERDKFVKAKNRYEENPLKNLPPEAISEMNVVKGEDGNRIYVNGVRLRLHQKGYVPLELK